jgi:hypothetical protein
MLRVLSDQELAKKLTTNASTLVATKHSPEQYVRSLDKIYREVLKARLD